MANEGIPYTISNAVFQRRHIQGDSEIEVYNHVEDIRSKQMSCMQKVVGYWVGYYPRRHIERDGITRGLAKVLVHIDASGVVRVFYKQIEEHQVKTNYKGIIRFPHSRNASMIVGELEYTKNTHRIRFLLNWKGKRLQGSMSGWRDSLDFLHFTRAILLEPISDTPTEYSDQMIQQLADQILPQGYLHTEVDLFGEQIRRLRRIEIDIFHSLRSCKIFVPGPENPVTPTQLSLQFKKIRDDEK